MSAGAVDASVVIPCRGHAAALRRCLAGVLAQEAAVSYEVLVVDSGPEAAVAMAAEEAGVRLVREGEGLGPGEARNVGARHARGDVLLFVDADCVPSPGWLAAGHAAVRSGVRLAGGPVLDARPYHPIALSDNLLQFAEFPLGRPDGPATHFPGCNLAIARAEFLALGGFPAVRVSAGEDGAFARLVRERQPEGLRFVRAMAVRHEGRTGFRALLRHHRRFGYCRAVLGLSLSPAQRRLASLPLMTVPVAAKRVGYILGRGAAWDRGLLARTLLLLPLVSAGSLAWAIGFRHGLVAAGRGLA